MIRINEHFNLLDGNYLFSEIARRVRAYKSAHPDAEIISLGIGDVTRPLCASVIGAMHRAVDEMAAADTFRGYAPESGYDFLKRAIIEHDYAARGISLTEREVFINDGAKSALGHFGDLFDRDNTVAVSDPVYPVYVDANVMEGRAGEADADGRWKNILYLECDPDEHFAPRIPAKDKHPDMIYLCSPNNPTGNAMTKAQLTAWVEYARANQSLILFDSAYEAFISSPDIPHSIYEIEGAKEVAVEFRSFSKTAGFTGLRCGYTVVPGELQCFGIDGRTVSLNAMWHRHQSTKYNGTPYIVQRAAEAIYSPSGQHEIREAIAYYMNNARTIREGLQCAGFNAYGGRNAPYIWLETPDGTGSWEFFDTLLEQCQIVGTPGAGFGPAGEGYFRFTAFGNAEDTKEAIEKIKTWRNQTQKHVKA